MGTTKIRKKKYTSFGPYLLSTTLGEGEFGKVKLGWSKNSKSVTSTKQVAIKLIKRESIPKGSSKEIKVYREINALKKLNHPNIVKLDDVLQNSKYIGIVLEYASGGEFYKYIQSKTRLKDNIACRFFAQLISGVRYMHSKGLVHRDLKLENLLLDKHENLIITDFGFVNEFNKTNELMVTPCGSPCYAAPELVTSMKPYEARKADIWSCGIILYAMLAGYLPWDDDSQNPDGADIARLYYYITNTSIKFPEYITPLPRDLLRHILTFNYKKRYDMTNIINHEWLKPYNDFLSISVDYWDKMIPIKKLIRSTIVPTTNNSNSTLTSSTNSSITDQNRRRKAASIYYNNNKTNVKRDSLIIDTTLVQLPVPPQESQSQAIVVNPTNSINKKNFKKGHRRGDSAASIALQAVVDQDNENKNDKSKILIDNNTIEEIKQLKDKEKLQMKQNKNFSFPIRKENVIDNIIEENSLINIDESIPHVSYHRSSSQRDSNVRTRPIAYSNGRHNKPRPTSYYLPSHSNIISQHTHSKSGSLYNPNISVTSEISLINEQITNNDNNKLKIQSDNISKHIILPTYISPSSTSNTLSSMKSHSITPPSIKIPDLFEQHHSHQNYNYNKRNSTIHSGNSIFNDNNYSHTRSQSNSTICKPFVDLHNVNGDITIDIDENHSMVKELQECISINTSSNNNNTNNRRYSSAISDSNNTRIPILTTDKKNKRFSFGFWSDNKKTNTNKKETIRNTTSETKKHNNTLQDSKKINSLIPHTTSNSLIMHENTILPGKSKTRKIIEFLKRRSMKVE